MSGMLRMVYASELIYSFALAFGLAPPTIFRIQNDANSDINLRNPRWHENLQKRLAVAASTNVGKVKSYCEKYLWITDSMKYVQLGRPELIHVVEKLPLDLGGGNDLVIN